jgi:protein-glutamine gamma-glutamyltransferase
VLTPHLPRDTRDTLFLLAVIGWITLLQTPHLPWWCAALTFGVLAWRGTLAWHNHALPTWPWRLGVLALALGATAWQHRTLLGQEAGVTLVVVLLALKTLELRARRDAFVVFFLGFFTLLTHFFYSQSLLTAVGILLALLGLLTALVNAHLPLGQPPLWHSARLAGGMALLGAPVMLVLFMLFPRLAPLWGIPNDGITGRSGLSGQMAVGQIARLALDDSVAFRVAFEGTPPAQSALYFRGPVLSRFDGRQWLPEHTMASPGTPPLLRVQGEPIRYQVTMEPSNRPWAMLLEAAPHAPALAEPSAGMTPDLQWLLRRPITDVLRYEAVSHTDFQHGPTQRTLALQLQLDLPPGFNPRTLQLAQDMQRTLGHGVGAEAYVQAALERLRTGGYRYTLEPGLYGPHTADEFWFDNKTGFCEHIASSFVVLMRALDIPARVVTGYQGGERNPVDGIWTVRQSDAHAWAEVWLAGRGWVRVDPTTQVMPSRTGGLDRLRPAPGLFTATLGRVNPTLLLELRHLWEATNNRWNQWVLNYTQSKQLDLLKQLGFSSPNWMDLARVLGGLLALVSLLGAAWGLWTRQRHDPWLQLLAQAKNKLERAGWVFSEHSTPRQMALQLGQGTDPANHPELQQWLLAMERQRYDPHSQVTLAQLRRGFKHLTWPAR